ncbi:hypothetical protein EV175_007181, partial [Coemansia sp. RSA 1933]
MKFLVGILAASAVASMAQPQGSNEGPNHAASPRTVSNANVNLGAQAQGSHFENGVSGTNVVGGLLFGAFDTRPVNEAAINNNGVNPSESNTAGIVVSTVNGIHNNVKGIASGSVAGLHRRDTVLNIGPNNPGLFPASIR